MSVETKEKGVRCDADAVRKSSTLQSVNHNRLQFTNAMQLYFYWLLFLLLIFGRVLLTHVSLRCFVQIPFRSISGDNRFGWHFLFSLLAKKKERKKSSSHRHHTHEGRPFTCWQSFCNSVFMSSRPPSQIENLNRLSSAIENYSFCSFDKNDLCGTVGTVVHPYSWTMCLAANIFSFDDSFHFFFQFQMRAGERGRGWEVANHRIFIIYIFCFSVYHLHLPSRKLSTGRLINSFGLWNFVVFRADS